MQVFFIEQNFKKSKVKAIFKQVELNNDRVILNIDCNKINIKKKIKLVKKLEKVLQINAVDTIIIEKKLKENKEFMNLLYSNNIKMIERKISI